MTDAEKNKLMKWLDFTKDYFGESSSEAKHARALQRVLDEPRLPKVPSAFLLDAMIVPEVEFSTMAPVERRRRVYDALHAHLTKPTTKKVVRIRGRSNQNGGQVDIILDLPISQTEVEVPA